MRTSARCGSVDFCISSSALSNFRCRLVRTFTHSRKLRTTVSPRVDFGGQLRNLTSKRCSIVTCNVLTADRLGSSLLLAAPVILGGRILIRHGLRGVSSSSLFVGDRLSLTKGALRMIGNSPSVLHVHGLKGRVNSAVCIRRVRGCNSRRLVTLMTRKSVSCTMYSRDVTHATTSDVPRVSVGATVDFARFCS